LIEDLGGELDKYLRHADRRLHVSINAIYG